MAAGSPACPAAPASRRPRTAPRRSWAPATRNPLLPLPAGGVATLRLSSFGLANALLVKPGLHRLRLEVVVADRAGNVERRSHTLRVRVAARSLRTFKVDADHGFAMFSAAGNRAVGRLVNALIEGLAAETIRARAELTSRYEAGVRAVERAGKRRVGDTAVGEALWDALEVPCTRFGYDLPL